MAPTSDRDPRPRLGRRDRGGERGRFLVLDGIDGCGKSTQAERLVAALAERGDPPPLHLREPGSTAAGERIRALLLDPAVDLGPQVEALLFAAARRQMLDEIVRPALEAGRDVVCERFHPATYAYQGVAGEVDEEELLALLQHWAGEPAPDLVVLLDLDVRTAVARTVARNGARAGEGAATDRIEAKGTGFQERVAEGFRRYAARFPGVVVVDAGGSADEVSRRVLAEVERARH